MKNYGKKLEMLFRSEEQLPNPVPALSAGIMSLLTCLKYFPPPSFTRRRVCWSDGAILWLGAFPPEAGMCYTHPVISACSGPLVGEDCTLPALHVIGSAPMKAFWLVKTSKIKYVPSRQRNIPARDEKCLRSENPSAC